MIRSAFIWLTIILATVCSGGCATSLHDYIRNGFKVGPNYCPPEADVAEHWIDASDKHLNEDREIPCRWWKVFNDPVLDGLVWEAYQQNLTLKEAGSRILQARADLGIAIGKIFPQDQTAKGEYSRSAQSRVLKAGETKEVDFSNKWSGNFSLAWELDFWGRYRRAVTNAEENLQASCADYDAALVTLLGDVAIRYVQVRTDQKRIRLIQDNVDLQRGVLQFLERRLKAGFRTYDLDVEQARSTLAQTEAAIPALESDMRQAGDRLCVLMGIPPVDLVKRLGEAPIPTTPTEIAVGLPAELLRRRPDVVRAERLAAAQAEKIGIAEVDLYPIFSINGTLGYQANNLKRMFSDDAFTGSIGPSFNWKILNYGRIKNEIRYQDARFCELVYAYRQTVLEANQEVEDGLVTFLRTRQRAELLAQSVDASQKAVKIVIAQFQKGAVDFNRYALIAQNLVTQEDLMAQAQGNIANGLIAVYRSLGGGWEIRCEGSGEEVAPESAPSPPAAAPQTPNAPEEVPKPAPAIPEPRKFSADKAKDAADDLDWTEKTDDKTDK